MGLIISSVAVLIIALVMLAWLIINKKINREHEKDIIFSVDAPVIDSQRTE